MVDCSLDTTETGSHSISYTIPVALALYRASYYYPSTIANSAGDTNACWTDAGVPLNGSKFVSTTIPAREAPANCTTSES